MNNYTAASKFNKALWKNTIMIINNRKLCGLEFDEQQIHDEQYALLWKEHLAHVAQAKLMQTSFSNPENEKIKGYFFIGVRPTLQTSLKEFIELVNKWMNRSEGLLSEYTCVLEQKGESDETLGEGFHMHMLVRSDTCRSKPEMIRYLKSTFGKTCPEPDVEILTFKNRIEERIKYITEHQSIDGHKEPTMEWDKKWRNNIGINNTYIRGDGPIKSRPSFFP